MNERIRELLLQAGFTNAYTDPKEGFELVFVDEEHTTESVTKFAELVVLEMCNVLDKAQWDKGEDWVCADSTRIIPQIKQHFGVEE